MSSLNGRNILSISDLTQEEVKEVFQTADRVENLAWGQSYAEPMKGKVLATLFFEPSTRTRLSFETAMLRMGGQVISTTDQASSLEKGESFEDTGSVISRFADLMVWRHPAAGSAARFASRAKVPVINAGDGANEHPTQALLDLYSILKTQHLKTQEKMQGLKIGLIGDLKYGRAAHSLIRLLGLYSVQVYLISDPNLALPSLLRREAEEKGLTIVEAGNLKDVIGDLDVLYVTRIQKERFESESEYQRLRQGYQVSLDLLRRAKSSLSILHPLPRIDELPIEIDQDARAFYFDQVTYGVAVRMALLLLISGRVDRLEDLPSRRL